MTPEQVQRRRELLERKRELLMQKKQAMSSQGDTVGTEQGADVQSKQADMGVDLMGALGKVAGGAWDAFKDTNVVPLKDFKGNTLKYKDVPGVIGNAAGEVGNLLKGIWSPTETETYKSIEQAYDVAKQDPAGFAMQAPVAMAKGAIDDLVLGGIGTAKEAPLSTFSVAGKTPALANKFMKMLARGAKTGGKATLSRLSGVPEDLLSDIAGQRRLGKESLGNQSFNAGLKDATMDEFAQKIQNIVGKDLPEEGIRKRNEAFSRLTPPDEGFDSVQLLVDLNDKLNTKGIKMGRDGLDFSDSVISQNSSAQNKVLNMVNVLNEKIRSNDMDVIQRGLDEAWAVVESVPFEQKQVRKILTDVWGNYREAIGNQVPGFNELKKISREGIEVINGFRRNLFGNASEKTIQETIKSGATNKSLVAALDHLWSPNGNRNVQRQTVDELSKMVKNELGEDVDIKRVAGGLRVASGSRSRFGTTLDVLLGSGGLLAGFSGDIGTAAGGILAAIISSATVQNPRVAARIAQGFGASEKVADTIADRVKTIRNAVEAKGINAENLSASAALAMLAAENTETGVGQQNPTLTQLLSRAQQQRSQSNQPIQ